MSWEVVLDPHSHVIVNIGLQMSPCNDTTVNKPSGSRPVAHMGPIADSVGSWEKSIAGKSRMDQWIVSVSVRSTTDLVTKEPCGLVLPWTPVQWSVLWLRAPYGRLWTA
jgi:hypothetical protein